MTSTIADAFRDASCQGWLCAESASATTEVSGDEPVVAASVIKVLIALAAESAFVEGVLDPVQQIRLSALGRTPGPVGFSLFADDVTASSRDLVSAMLTISDNAATDALLNLIGIEACNRLASELGLTGTLIVSDLRAMIESIARAAGFADWPEMTAWSEATPSIADRDVVESRIRAATALEANRATRTTARDMCRLLRMIWDDQAGPSAACARVRMHMGRQLTRHRLAAAFPSSRVAAKSGGLMGIVRNEVGVIEQPDGQRFFVGVFTRAYLGANEVSVNAAIGKAAAAAVASLSR